jgi:hypothetical protein
MDLHRTLAEKWRQEAALHERRGLIDAAAMARSYADELEAFDLQRGLEALTLAQDSAESGYSKDHLALLVAKGTIANAGEKRAPRIRRHDLPKKPKRSLPKLPSGEPDLHAIVTAAKGASR